MGLLDNPAEVYPLLPPMSPATTYYGGEFHFLLGFGLTQVNCKGECGQSQTYRYLKVCFGGAIGGGFGGGLVHGMDGKTCRSETYAGYFYEAGASLGPWSGGFDIGYNDTGGLIPLPNGPSGVAEGGFGPGFGARLKSTWCYYFPLQ